MKHLIPVLALLAAPALASEKTIEQIAAMPPSDVVFIGELHDNPWHHENQARLVAAFSPSAIVMEMLTDAQAARITPDLRKDMDALEAALEWGQSGWPSFAWYYPILQAAPLAPVYGAQVPRDQVREAIMGGDVAAAFGSDADQFGLTQPLDEEEQATREDEQFASHCDALPREMLPGMVLGQRLRDATLARQITRALKDTGGPVVVITGNGHARTDWGAPRLLGAGIESQSIAQLETAPKGELPYDYWILTPEAEREDPCKAFSKN